MNIHFTFSSHPILVWIFLMKFHGDDLQIIVIISTFQEKKNLLFIPRNIWRSSVFISWGSSALKQTAHRYSMCMCICWKNILDLNENALLHYESISTAEFGAFVVKEWSIDWAITNFSLSMTLYSNSFSRFFSISFTLISEPDLPSAT